MIKQESNENYYEDENGNTMSKGDFYWSLIASVSVFGLMVTSIIGAISGNHMLMQFSVLFAILLTLIKIEFNQ